MTLVSRLLRLAENGLIASLLVLATGVLFVDIFSRFLFGYSFAWAAEFARYAIIWMVFIGASVAARDGLHISIDLLQQILPRSAARLLAGVVLLLGILFGGFLVVYGVPLVRQMQLFGQISTAMEVPMFIVYLVLPLSGLLIAFRFAERLWLLAFRRDALDAAPQYKTS